MNNFSSIKPNTILKNYYDSDTAPVAQALRRRRKKLVASEKIQNQNKINLAKKL